MTLLDTEDFYNHLDGYCNLKIPIKTDEPSGLFTKVYYETLDIARRLHVITMVGDVLAPNRQQATDLSVT